MTIDLPQIPVVERFVVEMTNTLREEKKLGEVHSNAQLKTAATAYADYLAKSKTFSHTADGRQAGDRISEAGYQWCTIGENLATHLNSQRISITRACTPRRSKAGSTHRAIGKIFSHHT